MQRSVLILDEDQRLGQLLKSVLDKLGGYAVETCDSGITGLEMLKDGAYDLAVIGERLCDVDGLELAARIRQEKLLVKLVFVTSTWGDTSLYRVLKRELGVLLVLHRPIRQSLFGAQIETLFAREQGTIQQEERSDAAIFEEVREKFYRGLPARISAIEDIIVRCKSAQDNYAYLKDAHRLTHNMKGTSRSLGMEEFGVVMQKLESTFLGMQDEDQSTIKMQWPMIDELMASAKVLIPKVGVTTRATTESAILEAAMLRLLVVSKTPLPAVQTANGLPVETVQVSTSGDAFEQASKCVFDAVMIDTMLEGKPEKSFRLARDLRNVSGYETLPLAFLSSNGTDEDLVDSTHAGSSMHISVKLDDHSMKQAVEHLINLRQGGRSRILIVDDDEDFAEVIARLLGREGMLVRMLHDPASILDVVREFKPDMVLLDVMMPAISGFDVCRLLRAQDVYQDLPIFFLTGETQLSARVNAFESGGDDYLPKPVVPVELLTRVKSRLERSRLLKDRMEKDVLTGLLLRRPLMEQVNALFHESKRHNLNFSVCLLDVDKFKHVNDTHGHLTGDRVLQGLGKLLKKRFRVEDLRGRWGGEEFVVILRHATKDTSQGALQRVLEEFGEMQFESDDGVKFSATFSAGITGFPQDAADSVQALLKLADTRLYEAKAKGRNRIIIGDN